MQIQVEVISVSAVQTIPTKNGKSYQAVEVAYKKDGKIEGKKIMSFTNPAVFKAAQNLEQGQVIDITTEKNEAGYWQWEAIATAGSAPAQAASAPAATAGGGKAQSSGGNWETKEERAARQVMIVRQSSLGHSVALLGSKAKVPEVISVAKEFEAYVLGTDTPDEAAKPVSFDDFPDDVPL